MQLSQCVRLSDACSRCAGEKQAHEPEGLDPNGERAPNATEVLLYTMLLYKRHPSDEIARWAAAVRSAVRPGAAWTRPPASEWQDQGRLSGLEAFLDCAVGKGSEHDQGSLDQIGEAMQRWELDGACDRLNSCKIRTYLIGARAKGTKQHMPPRGPRIDRKTAGGVRWCKGSIRLVADVVTRHGAELVAALTNDNLLIHCPLTKQQLHAIIAELRTQVASLEQQIADLGSDALRARDALRKASARAKLQKEARRAAVSEARQRAREQFDARLAKAKVGQPMSTVTWRSEAP